MKKLTFAGVLFAMALVLTGADDSCGTSTGDRKQVQQQAQLSSEAAAQVGMPGVQNFTERKLVRLLYELRDKEVATYVYLPDMAGRLWHLCDGVGYGLPYGTQFTNPERPAERYETHETGNLALPQAEPNGLYMPPTAEGTWVICGSKGNLKPVYVEPKVIVSPFRLRAEGEYQEK